MAKTQSMISRLECTELRKSYGAVEVLAGVGLTVGHGETVAIMGRSGCGKSTLLRCLALLEDANKGDAYLEGQQYLAGGKPVFAPWQLRSQVTLIFQEFNLFPHMTGLRNLTIALEEVRGMPAADAKEVAVAMARRLGIEQQLQQYPETLSGGEAQRLALARAMLLQPSVLLCDEITSALDPESIASVVEAIRHIRAADERGGLGIVLVTHLLHFAAEFADRIAFMHNGVILEEGPARKFAESCQSPEARDFVARFGQPL